MRGKAFKGVLIMYFLVLVIKYLDKIVGERIILYREIFHRGIVNPEIHHGTLGKEEGEFFILNGAGKINLITGDRILFNGWEKVFLKPLL